MNQQQQAAHRKTEEIRHAINNDNMKLAIKLALKLEKNDVARAMLAFCYNRTGKRDEALEICESLAQAALYDDHVLHWLSYVYAYSRRLDLLAKVRKSRMQIAPASGELFFYAAVDCLFAYAKIYDFKEADLMVKKIMAVNRAEARPMMDTLKLSIWAATFGFLRSQQESDDKMTLMLSSSYLEKSQTPETAGLPLKRWIQIKRGLFDEALNTLAFLPNESNASKFWMRSLLTRLSGNKEEQEFNVLCDLVRDAPDDFRAWARLCQLAAAVDDAKLENELRVLIKEKCALPLRGPQLALVRLELELFLRKQDGDGGKALKCAVVDFVKRFTLLNHVVFSDLQNDLLVFCLGGDKAQQRVELPAKAQVCAYLLPQHEYVQMDRESRRWPVESISARVAAEVREDFFAELKSLSSSSSQAMQILRYCGAYETSTVDELMQIAQPLLLATASDEEVLFASALLQDLFIRTEDINLLLLACAALERRMDLSKDNFEIKLALHELYSYRLGAPLCGLPAYAMLRIKQIQCDALGHVSLANLSNYGFFEESKQFATNVCDFNAKARGECADSFATAFEHCEISSPVEMYRLEVRLKDSLQFHLSLVERAWMSLLPTTASGREVSVLTKLNVEVNSPAQGKSAICFPENRLAVTFANRANPSALVWNADLAVEYCCDAPFGVAFTKSLKAAATTGPNARIARELLGSKQALQAWRERELKWCELRTSAACALIGAEVKETALTDMEALITELDPSQEKQTSLVWKLGIESLRVLVTRKLPESLFALLSETELAWREQQVKFTKEWIVQVSTALTNAGMWLFTLVSRFNAQAKKQGANSLPFEPAYLTKLQAMSTKLFSRISQNMRELKQNEDKRVFVPSSVVVEFDLAAVHEKVKRSHSESLSRLAALASSLASFE